MPEGTTWLDLATLAIAAGGFVIGSVGLILTVRRDRRQGRVGLALSVESVGGSLVVRITNSEVRPVSAEYAGLSRSKQSGRPDPYAWDYISHHVAAGRVVGERPLPKTLEPGDPAYSVTTPLHRAKAVFVVEPPTWVWCEDNYKNIYWERIPGPARTAIAATKRRKRGPDDDYGQRTYLEIDDEDDVAPDELA